MDEHSHTFRVEIKVLGFWFLVCNAATQIALRLQLQQERIQVLMVELIISRTNANSQWNPVYNAFFEIFVVEIKQFVSSFVNVILMRQTCGQRSSRAAESKRQAIGKYIFRANLLYVPNIKM